MNYTKGEWRVGEPFVKGQDYPIYSEDGYELARAFIYNGEQKANAHLIAAAPDMYEALKQLMVDYRVICERKPRNTILQTRLSMAVKALAKAEGKG